MYFNNGVYLNHRKITFFLDFIHMTVDIYGKLLIA